jgi:hypothetical protein
MMEEPYERQQELPGEHSGVIDLSEAEIDEILRENAVPFAEDEWPRLNSRPDEEIYLGKIPEGYYTVNGHVLRVVETAYVPEKEKGTLTVGYIPTAAGRSLDAQYFAFIYADKTLFWWPQLSAENTIFPFDLPEAVQELVHADDPIDYGEEYAKSSGFCWNCGKPLSRDQSITRGMGPICWAKLGGRDREDDVE